MIARFSTIFTTTFHIIDHRQSRLEHVVQEIQNEFMNTSFSPESWSRLRMSRGWR